MRRNVNEPCARPADLERSADCACRFRRRRTARTALSAVHRPLRGLRRRYAGSLGALEKLPSGEERMFLVEAGQIAIPPSLVVLMEARVTQMVAERPHEKISDSRIQPLTEADAADMLDLATLTKPGPFTLRAQSLGCFWGIRQEGRLVAMAGQRMRQIGFIELSGLCTHPDFQGRGLGSLLFRFVAGEIASGGDTAYLHAYAANTSAISLYAAHGFVVRSEMNMCVVKRPT
ncbi:GCN5-related N-acetyltransferase protein [Rhizobium etli]|uniref:GCN5-related N-acetyltransferase protein n=1 Tax=Rhizobium etli TaxID=29449 RepID=A0AAN1BFF5_RHIET|nr:GCN5-related N-acetyltransferase protein [Rhizobium etli]